jgi:hypothetical protein
VKLADTLAVLMVVLRAAVLEGMTVDKREPPKALL